MKLVQELIGYLYGRGQLDDDDLGVLSKEGFYPQDIQPETQSDDEDASENPEINDDEQSPLSIEEIEERKAAAEDGLSKKGKGRRAFKPEKKWSLEQFNAELLPQIEALDDTFSPLYRLLMKGNKAEIRQILAAPFIIDEDYIKDTLERVLLYHYGQEPDLARAVLMTDYLESFFVLTKKLSPKNRDRVREWILGKKFLHPEPHRETIFWARQMLDLQIRILKIWRDLTPSVLNHHHKMGYGKPFLAKASEQEEGRLAAQLLMSFVFLHNFDNPTKPETTLFLLLEKEGRDDAYQTMSVFFQKEMQDLWLRVGDANEFDMPYWLHKLNERHDNCLFLETDLWTFDATKQTLPLVLTQAKSGQKLVLDNTVCDRAWFRYVEKLDDMDRTVAGVFCDEYDDIGVFSEGLAAVEKDGKWGFIDARGILVIPCQYKSCWMEKPKFIEGYIACRRASDNKHLYLDKYGNNAFPDLEKQLGDGIDYVNPFSEGYARIKTSSEHWFVIDRLGRVVLDKEKTDGMAFLSDFNEGLADFRQDIGEIREYGLINPLGDKFIIKNTELESYNYLHPLREGRAAIRNNQDLWGFVDAECRLVIPCIYEWAWSFSEGRSAVCRDGLWGFIDRDGHEIVPPQYKITEPYSDGFGGFSDAFDNWGFLNLKGVFFKGHYDETLGFSEGQAIVKKNGRTYFLDTYGNENYCYSFNPSNLTDGYFVCFDPPSGLKILRKNLKTLATIPNVRYVEQFRKSMNAFEFDRVYMFNEKDYSCSPYTVEKNWCLSEGFIGVNTDKTSKWTFAFLEKSTEVSTIDPRFDAFYNQMDIFLVDKQHNISIIIARPHDGYLAFEWKIGNRITIKINDEAITLRLDLIFEKIWKLKV